MVRPLIPVGILLGILCCFLHEILHALPQRRNATAYVGFIPKAFLFYMKCKEPVTKSRFILMSLLPVVLGIVPLLIFMISGNKTLNAIMWPMAMIGLASPAPDYRNVFHVCKEVPRNGYIQDDKEGMCWYTK